MSMLQLLGGVAVAGVVAAGTTAFTGAGLVTTNAAAVIGGTQSVSVIGAELTEVHFVMDPTNYARMKSVDLVFADENADPLADGAIVEVTPTGTAGASTDNDLHCASAGTVNSAITCTAGTTLAPTGGYFTAVSALSVTVVPA